ncbi:glycosyltransferase family 4 protein [bacterium]|nr:glycosyltransferase family 4 protein [bacterium]
MTDHAMRITVVENDGAGGMIHYAYQMCSALAAEGADVTLVTSQHYELGTLEHSFEVDARLKLWRNIEPTRTPGTGAAARALAAIGKLVRRAWRGVRFFIEWNRLTRRLIEQRPDIVQFATIRFPFQALFLRRMQRAGLTLTQVCHEWQFREARLPILRSLNDRLARHVYPPFSAIFLHGEANLEAFSAMYPGVERSRLHAILHGDESMLVAAADGGGDSRSRYGLPPDRPVAVFFGGLRPSKGVDDLIEAFALARPQVEASLVVAGYASGVDPDAYRASAGRLGIGPDVVIDARYLPLGEVAPLLRIATVVVLPYRSATASGVLQASYAAGRPVIVTDVGGLPEAVVDGSTGFVVPVSDPDALATALIKMLSDPAEAAEMGMAALAYAHEHYSWQPIAGEILAVSREVSQR